MLIINLVLTQECNLGCKYCYMKNIKEYMTKEIFDIFYLNIEYMLKEFNQKDYSIVLFGGEPTLNWELVEYISSVIQKDKKCNGKHIITNGTLLTTEKIDFLKRNNISYSISFDGLCNKEIRPFKNGKSSLDYYIQNKDILFENGRLNPKVMISPDSVKLLIDNYKFFRDVMKLTSPDFTIVRDNIWSDEDVNYFDKELTKLTNIYIEDLKNNKMRLMGFYYLAFADIIVGSKYDKRSFGCFAGVNGIGVMPNGNIYPCARFGSEKKDLLYEININNKSFYKYDNRIINDKKLYNPKVFEKCKKCELYKYCNAGCTFEQILDNNEAVPIENICKLFKIIYRESLIIWNELKYNTMFRKSICDF